ncbi:tetratricopeptide repeat protein [Parapedobacter sp. 10938]|uniref:tetratricopeptide repeat protein n=1 Tax=Parapedobacter flavus TaxID=3110225 RepID=UPI002DB5B8B8|nr:tetratricopeptide repeat protein [Parapedobacter sp. 10938]MEC3879195.1 tetratricopeptide repeat protein [Parapedobacter sp. 10938]
MTSGRLSKQTITLVIVVFFSLTTAWGNPLDSLERLLKHGPVDSSYIETQLKVSQLYHRQAQHGDRCMDLAAEAVQHAVDLGDTYLYAKALDNLGLLYRYHQYYAQAVPLHQKAFDLTEHLPIPPLSKMIFANNTGVAARHNGNFDVSVAYYLKALAIAETEQDNKNREIANNGLGIALMSIPGREQEALEHLRQALDIAKASGNTLGQAMNYLSIGSYYDEIGNHRTAREYLAELQRLNEKMDDKNGMAITLEAIGNSYLMEGEDLQTAKAYFGRSLSLYEALDNPLGQATVASSIGDVFRRQGQLDQALTAYSRAYDVGNELRQYAMIQHSAAAMSNTYEQQGDTKRALAYYRIAQQYKDSLAFHEQQVAISAIKQQYDLESKEAEIELLTKDKQLAEAKLHSRNLIIFVMVGLLAVVAGFGFVKYRVRRLKRRSEELIKQQKDARLKALYERNLMEAEIIATRMQINPHFMFNCLGSIRFLVERKEYDRALNYLVHFSRFIRRVLEISHRPVHRVCDELQLLDQYLKLEKNRFDGEFTYQIVNEMAEWENRDVIPALLLQPFVENAICHGLAPSDRKDKRLQIVAKSRGSAIQLTVEDNGVGLRKPAMECKDHKSMGHEITDKRIDLFNKSYRDHIQWNIENHMGPDGTVAGTRAQVAILIGDTQVTEMRREVS